MIFYCFKWFIYLLRLWYFNVVATVSFVCYVHMRVPFPRVCVCACNDFIANFTAFSDALPPTNYMLRSFIYLLQFSLTSPMFLMLCAIYSLVVFGTWHVYAASACAFFSESDTIKCCFSFFILFFLNCIVSSPFLPPASAFLPFSVPSWM